MTKKVIYKITYPNGKIYIGKDMTNSINYFGSADDSPIALDFSEDQRRRFTVTRDVIWASEDATLQEVNRREVELILLHQSNDPEIGYNRWTAFRGKR